VDENKVDGKVRSHLGDEISIKPYDCVWEDLEALRSQLEDSQQKLIITNRTSFAIESILGKENVSEYRSPITDFKAIKNETELEGMRQCHLRDAAALCNYFAWLEEQLKACTKLSEVDVADKLESYRKELTDFVGLSFDTISSTGPNGAIIHYKPERSTCAIVDHNMVYLCDSGGQYLDGTTDVTRTYHFGTPNAREKRCFTRVLQGHIAIDTAVFPRGVTGYLLDPFARTALWADGLDFRHGTGHGVGAFLNVHEGPHGIGTRIGFNDTPLQAGMTVTNEPGYYEDGKFGIRIENVLLVQDVKLRNNFGDRGYLGFEHVTLVTIGHNLIDTELLSPAEKKWVDDYHSECLAKVGPLLKPGSSGLKWLERETRAID
jgi:Xaa-Pro aminopeptidase